MSSDEMNCELMSPDISAAEFVIGPVTANGGLPGDPRYAQIAPSWVSASTSGPMGLRMSDSSPVRVVVDGRREAIPVIMRMVVPEFFASMTPSAGLSSSQWILIPPEELLISVPSA